MIHTMSSHDDTPNGTAPAAYVSTQEAARIIGRTEGRVRQLLISKKLAGFKVEGEQGWQVERASAERYREYLRRIAEANELIGGNADE